MFGHLPVIQKTTFEYFIDEINFLKKIEPLLLIDYINNEHLGTNVTSTDSENSIII